MTRLSKDERARRSAAFASWCVHHKARLDLLPEAVRAAVESLTHGRFMDGVHERTSDADVQRCAAAAATRLRLQRYGRLPSEPVEAARQLRECRRECGL